MKPALILAMAIASTATGVAVQAQTYQWKDGTGRTIISDSPPPASARQSRALPGMAAASGKVTDTPKSLAERDMEFKKRQQETLAQEQKTKRDSAASVAKNENCQLARRQIALLESGQRVAGTDDYGTRRLLDDAGRQREKEQMHKFLADNCN